MSDPNPLKTHENALLLGLARGSLLLVSMPWLMAGCLIPDPEKFPEPQRTAIELDTNQVTPAINQILRVTPPEPPREFKIAFRSVDLGDPPAAYLYLDYETDRELLLGQDTLQTPSNDGAERFFSVFANFPTCERANDQLACCQRVTLIAMHESSVTVSDAGIPKPDPVRAQDDQARVIWWVEARRGGTTPPGFGGCPTTPTGTP